MGPGIGESWNPEVTGLSGSALEEPVWGLGGPGRCSDQVLGFTTRNTTRRRSRSDSDAAPDSDDKNSPYIYYYQKPPESGVKPNCKDSWTQTGQFLLTQQFHEQSV